MRLVRRFVRDVALAFLLLVAVHAAAEESAPLAPPVPPKLAFKSH